MLSNRGGDSANCFLSLEVYNYIQVITQLKLVTTIRYFNKERSIVYLKILLHEYKEVVDGLTSVMKAALQLLGQRG